MALRILSSHLRAIRLLRTGCLPAPGELRRRLHAARESPSRFTRPVRLLVTPLVDIPFCHGVFRPAIIFPENWSDWEAGRAEICMAHEMAHIVRRDLLAMFASQLTCILCWFNPLVWLAAAKLRDEAEIAADDMVLARNIRPETYAEALLAITEKCRAATFAPASILSMARASRLKTRIVAILDSTLQRNSPGLRLALFLGAVAAIAVVGAVGVRLTTPAYAADAAAASGPLPTGLRERAAMLEQVRRALETGDIKAVDSYLQRGLHVNELYGLDPLLYIAVDANKPALVKFLIAKGADVDKPTLWGDTCFKRACWRGYKEIADILIKAGEKVGRREKMFYLAGTGDVKGLEAFDAQMPIKGDATEGDDVEGSMAFAAVSGHPDTLAWLWKHKAPPDAAKKEKLIASLYVKAANWNQPGSLRYLESVGTPTAETLRTALEVACGMNFPETARYLLDKGVSPNEGGYPMLAEAARMSSMDIVTLLLDHGADIKAQAGQQALSVAGAAGRDDICALLLKRGADASTPDRAGQNAAWYFASGRCPDSLDLALKTGVNVPGTTHRGETILRTLMESGRPGADEEWDNTSPARIEVALTSFVPANSGGEAASGGNLSEEERKDSDARERRTLDLLLAAGADLNATGRSGTPLMKAIANGRYEAARELVDKGADLPVKDSVGNSALGCLFRNPAPPLDILDTMLKHGCDPNAPNLAPGITPPLQSPILEEAIANMPGFDARRGTEADAGAMRAVKMLIDHGAGFAKPR